MKHDYKYLTHRFGLNEWKCKDCKIIISRPVGWRPSDNDPKNIFKRLINKIKN